MKIAAIFSPNARANINTTTGISSGQFNAQLPAGEGKILVYNSSLVDLIFTFNISSFIDIVPAQSIRVFDLQMASWLVTWASALPVAAGLNNNVITSQTQCYVVVYESSEDVPSLAAITSYVNPFSVVIQAGRDVEFTGMFTGNTTFNLTTVSTFNRPVYLQMLLVSIRPTLATADHVMLDIVDNVGNDLCHFYIGPEVTTAGDGGPYVNPIYFDPAIIYQGGTVTITGSFSSSAGAGNSGGCSVTMFTYYC